jgi:sorting nexin-9/18/33
LIERKLRILNFNKLGLIISPDRRSILQLWVNKICRHPVLNQSEVWNHFLTCTDEAKWKKGKRQAEKDEYVGGNFLICVSAPDQTLDSANV